MTRQSLVAGVDSSTQSCKVMIHDAKTGELVRSGAAFHRAGTEVSADVWYRAFVEAVKQAGGLDDVEALCVGGQQHGMVTLDEKGRLVRDAILWNDTRSAPDAKALIDELGEGETRKGMSRWVQKVGSVPVASLTVTKLRWLTRCEPGNLRKTAAIALPHDWLSWKITGSKNLDDLFTDRSEASGTGYFDANTNEYLPGILKLAAGESGAQIKLPRIVNPGEIAREATVLGKALSLGSGCGDNAGASLGLDLKPGQVAMSIGTSGVISMVANKPVLDNEGRVTCFADATGRFLPLVGTLNASKVMDTVANLLGVDFAQFSNLALSAPPGAEGLVFIPYFAGERTPNLPDATGSLHGVNLKNFTSANLARAAVEAMVASVGSGIDILRELGVPVTSVALIGGGSRLEAVCRIAPVVLGLPVTVPEPGEYVAEGAARQAAWVLSGSKEPPPWKPRLSSSYEGKYEPFILQRYNEVKHLFANNSQLNIENKDNRRSTK